MPRPPWDTTSADSEWSNPGIHLPPAAEDAPQEPAQTHEAPGKETIETAKALVASLEPLLERVLPEDALTEALMDVDHDPDALLAWVRKQLEDLIHQAVDRGDGSRVESLKDLRFDVIQAGTRVLW